MSDPVERRRKAIQSMEDTANQGDDLRSTLSKAFQDKNTTNSDSPSASIPQDPSTASSYGKAMDQLHSDESKNAMDRLNNINDQMDWASDEDKNTLQKQKDDLYQNFPKLRQSMGQ